MSFRDGCKTLFNLRTLIVVLAFSGIVYYYYSNQDWTGVVRVTVEQRVDLMTRLSSVLPGAPLYLDASRNEDVADLYIQASPDSEFTYKNIPIHSQAHLKVKYGFLFSAGEEAAKPVTFEVEVRTREGMRKILDETLTPSGRGLNIRYKECSFGEIESAGADLVFRCTSDHAYPDGSLLCGWGDLKIDSSGERDKLKNIDFTRYTRALVLKPEEALPGTPVTWARDGDQVYEHAQSWILDPNFSPGGYVRPAYSFASNGRIDFASIEVPDEDEAALVFALGLRELSCNAGGAGFTVMINDQAVFEESLSDGAWRERSIDLSPHAGEPVRISFDVRFTEQTPKTLEGAVRIEHAIAGIAGPRILAGENTGRRFSSKRDAPNMIFIHIDGLNRSALGCCGSPLGLTPCMDRMAETGVLFSGFVSSSSNPLMSTASVLTGYRPSVHGVGKGRKGHLEDPFTTLPEIMQERGITTAAFIASKQIDASMNLDQGFETFIALPGQNARKVNALFNDWLISNENFRFFAYLHFGDPDEPFNAPTGLKNRYVSEEMRDKPGIYDEVLERVRGGAAGDEEMKYLRGRHFGEIEYLDRRLQDLLNLLAKYNILHKTIFVLTGSCGQAFMEHGTFGHGTQLYGESIHVPLILCGPGEIVGTHQVRSLLKDHHSLYGTAAYLMGIPLEEEFPSLYPMEQLISLPLSSAYSETDRSRRDPLSGEVLGETLHAHMWESRAVYKLIWGREAKELYNLHDDPGEGSNLLNGEPLDEDLRAQIESILNADWTKK